MTTPKSPREIAEKVWVKLHNFIYHEFEDIAVIEEAITAERSKAKADRKELLEGIKVAVEALRSFKNYTFGKEMYPDVAEDITNAKSALTTLNSLLEKYK